MELAIMDEPCNLMTFDDVPPEIPEARPKADGPLTRAELQAIRQRAKFALSRLALSSHPYFAPAVGLRDAADVWDAVMAREEAGDG